MVSVYSVNQRVTIDVDVKVVVTVVWAPLHDDMPVHLRDLAVGQGSVDIGVAVVIQDEVIVKTEWVEHPSHVPVHWVA